jgi:hypothetical protein
LGVAAVVFSAGALIGSPLYLSEGARIFPASPQERRAQVKTVCHARKTWTANPQNSTIKDQIPIVESMKLNDAW